jgi:hypothetical protein
VPSSPLRAQPWPEATGILACAEDVELTAGADPDAVLPDARQPAIPNADTTTSPITNRALRPPMNPTLNLALYPPIMPDIERGMPQLAQDVLEGNKPTKMTQPAVDLTHQPGNTAPADPGPDTTVPATPSTRDQRVSYGFCMGLILKRVKPRPVTWAFVRRQGLEPRTR